MTAALVFAFGPGCIQNSTPPSSSVGGTGLPLGASGSATVGGATIATTTETQCLIFQGNSSDYTTCLACKSTLCTNCVTPGSCTALELAACTVNSNSLAQCVHSNVVGQSNACIGLVCGQSQVANFSTCLCTDATPPGSIGPSPGQEDQLIPYLQPGFFVSNRFCPQPDVTSVTNFSMAPPNSAPTDPMGCLETNAGAGTKAGGTAGTYVGQIDHFPGAPPIYVSQPPANVYQDVGYVRWDLALDASQYSPGLPLANNLPFINTFSTFPVTLSLFYQLKPNTLISPNMTSNVAWNDCVEHFSGSVTGANVSTNNLCDPRPGAAGHFPNATSAVAIPLSNPSGLVGTAQVPNISVNGSAANANITDLQQSIGNPPFYPGNPNLQMSGAPAGTTGLGLAKADAGPAALNSPSTSGTGLFSNIGFYKYTWGQFNVRQVQPPSASDIATGTVTGRIAINMNMGYTPAGAVESTALSPDALTNTLTTRDCSANITPHPCVVTAVYRAAGGAILSQSMSPRFTTTNQNQSTNVQTLPSGITAVSTPKIIQDIAQDSATSTLPARLRVFAKADDGNIYMSRYENGQWNSWMTLGRPWMCTSNAPGDCTTYAALPGVAAVYKPIPIGFLGGGNPAGDYTGKPNDGISIVGEPVVASYMNTDPSQPNVYGAIAIFVRVSQLQSSDSTMGPYHNAVFFTVGTTQEPRTAGKITGFDNPMNWSQWMPVTDGANILHIQGNPTVIFRGNTTGSTGTNPFLTLFATDAENDAGANLLHPPIAFNSTAAKTGFCAKANCTQAPPLGTLQTYDDTAGPVPTSLPPFWFNYGHKILGTSLSTLNGTSTQNLYKPTNTLSWTAIGAGGFVTPAVGRSAGANVSVVSDVTYGPIFTATPVAGNIRDFSEVRLFYKVLQSMNAINPVDTNAGAANNAVVVSPEFYDTAASVYNIASSTPFITHPVAVPLAMNNPGPAIEYMDVHLVKGGPPTLVAGAGCAGLNPAILDAASTFVGNVWPVTLAPATDNQIQNSKLADPVPPALTKGQQFAFGRAYCINKSECDPVNPSLAYIALQATDCAGESPANNHTVYYSGGAATEAGAGPVHSSTPMVQPTSLTSDVIPIFSRSLDVNSNDVPAYIFTRNQNGNITTGYWGASHNGSGIQSYITFPTGGFTN